MILVFVGAGGSAAVDPKQYPTTVEFFNRLPPGDITGSSPSFKQSLWLPERTQKEDGQRIDIEEVLWRLRRAPKLFLKHLVILTP